MNSFPFNIVYLGHSNQNYQVEGTIITPPNGNTIDTVFSQPTFGVNQSIFNSLEVFPSHYNMVVGILSTNGHVIPSNGLVLNPYQSVTYGNSNCSLISNGIYPIQAFQNNQGGNLCRLVYSNTDFHTNRIEYPVDSTGCILNIQQGTTAFTNHSNGVHLTAAYRKGDSNDSEQYGKIEDNHDSTHPIFQPFDQPPLNRSDSSMISINNNTVNYYKGQSRNQANSGLRIQKYSKKLELECNNCEATKTTTWRRTKGGDRMCNACALYFQKHGVSRPLSMKSDKIQTRTRKKGRDSNIMLSGGDSGDGK
ncbi:Transcription factor GATA-6 [Thelohanellus kitauei]|uniref:Transcription factor GATA-6 n=1 Tax=Thelohanellus kitauei TaxID=669202 RepID=A0A0C2IVQ3_THEKT|nr:Transcription factor GATA-6 [Thelohanellus kitauei]